MLVILSEKYLRSPYCMNELYQIYSHSFGKKSEFLERVIPVTLDDAQEINDWRGQVKYAEYWENECKEMEPKLRLMGEDAHNRYRLIKRWYPVIGDILGFIADKLHPRSFDAIVKDDYAAVREMLPRT